MVKVLRLLRAIRLAPRRLGPPARVSRVEREHECYADANSNRGVSRCIA